MLVGTMRMDGYFAARFIFGWVWYKMSELMYSPVVRPDSRASKISTPETGSLNLSFLNHRLIPQAFFKRIMF